MPVPMQADHLPQSWWGTELIWWTLVRVWFGQASKAYYKGIDALRPDRLTTAFCTHLHTDHTAGYADLIFTPWVLERETPLTVFGPKGIRNMTEHIQAAYAVDIDFRLHGFERANEVGYQVKVHEIGERGYLSG